MLNYKMINWMMEALSLINSLVQFYTRHCRQSTLLNIVIRQLIRHNSNRTSAIYHAGIPIEPYKMQSCTNAQPTMLFISKTKSMCAFTNCVNTTSSCWSIGKMCEDLGGSVYLSLRA